MKAFNKNSRHEDRPKHKKMPSGLMCNSARDNNMQRLPLSFCINSILLHKARFASDNITSYVPL